MNIFVLDESPKTSARMLCDCHIRKMCIETAQILSAVMLRRGMDLTSEMPEPQNLNHPVIVAVDSDPEALEWVLHLNYELHVEYRHRFQKSHAYSGIVMEYIDMLWNAGDGSCENLAKCCGELDVRDLDVVTAYRKYYTEVKKPQLIEKNLWIFTEREDWTNAD